MDADASDVTLVMKGLIVQLEAAAKEATRVGENLSGGIGTAGLKLRTVMKELTAAAADIEKLTKLTSRAGTPTGRVNAAQALNPTLETAQLGRQAEAVGRIKAASEQAGTAVQALENRLRLMGQADGKAALEGNAASAKRIEQIDKLKLAQKELAALTTREGRLNTRFALLPAESRGELSDARAQLSAINAKILEGAANSRKFNFVPLVESAKQVTLQLERETAQQELLNKSTARQTTLEAEKVRQRARDILDVSPTIDRVKIQSQARQAGLVAQPELTTSEADARLVDATRVYTDTKRALLRAVQEEANPSILAPLIAQYDRLRQIIAETTAAQHQAAVRQAADTQSETAAEKHLATSRVAQTDSERRNATALREIEASRHAGVVANAAAEDRQKAAEHNAQMRRLNQEEAANKQGAAGRSIGQRLTSGFATTATYALTGGLTYGALSVFSEGAKFVIEYEDALKQLQAVSNSTDTQMVSLAKDIQDVASTSRYSTLEITKVANTLAQAGLSTADTGKALKSVAGLAAASGSELTVAADVTTSVLGAFQLQASDLGHVNDTLVSALNRSKLTLASVAAGIQYVGATAFENKVSLEELVATLGAVADAGVRGTTAATGLRGLLIDLENPSKKLEAALKAVGLTSADVDVSTHGLSAVLTTLRDKGFGAGEAFASLEKRTAAFYLVLKNNVDKEKELELQEALTNEAALAQSRAVSSLSANWTEFKNNLTGLVSDQSSPIVSFLTSVTSDLNSFLTKMREVREEREKSRLTGTESTATKIDDAIGRANIPNKIVGYGLGGSGGQKLADFLFPPEAAANIDNYKTKQEALTTASARAADVVANQQGKMAELNQEIVKLQLRSGDYVKGGPGFEAAVLQLEQKFSGLAGQIDKTGRNVYGVISAMRALGAIGNTALSSSIAATGQAYRATQENQTAESRRQAGSINLSPLPALAQSSVRAEITRLVNDPSRSTASLSDLTSGFADKKAGSPEMIKALRDLIGVFSGLRVSNSQIRSNAEEARTNRFQGDHAVGLSNVQALETSVPIKVRELAEATQADRIAGLAGLSKQVDLDLTRVKALIAKTKNPIDAAALTDAYITPLLSLQHLILEGTKIRPGEIKAATGIAVQKGKELHAILEDDASDARAAAGTPEFAAALKKVNADTAKYAANKLLQAGQHIAKLDLKGQDAADYYASASAEINAENDKLTKSLERAKGKSPAHLLEKAERYTVNSELKGASADLNSKLRAEGSFSSFEEFDAALKATQAALAAWVAAGLAKVRSEIKRNNLNKAQTDAALEAHDKEVGAKTLAVQMDAVTSFDNGLAKIMKQRTKELDEFIKAKLEAPSFALASAQGTLAALNDPIRGKYVADYQRSNQQRVVDVKMADLNQAQYGANEAAITSAQGTRDTINAAIAKAPVGYDIPKAQLDVSALDDKIRSLTVDNLKLGASFQHLEVPKSLKQGFLDAKQAIDSTSTSGLTFSQQVNLEMGHTIDNVSASFRTFASDILSGNKSIAASFGSLALSVVKTLEDLAVKILANKLLSMGLNLIASIGGSSIPSSVGTIGTTFGEAGLTGNFSSTPVTPTSFAGIYNGGMIRRAEGGGTGLVTNGQSTRDSVHALLSRGEYVTRRSAVESVGQDFMDNLNQHGAKALAGLGSTTVVHQKPPASVNIWLAPPEQQPQMGPRDVIVALTDDIIRGGSTRQLIHQIARDG